MRQVALPVTFAEELVHFRHKVFAVIIVLSRLLFSLALFLFIALASRDCFRLSLRVVSIAAHVRCLKLVNCIAEFLSMTRLAFLSVAHFLLTVAVLVLDISN